MRRAIDLRLAGLPVTSVVVTALIFAAPASGQIREILIGQAGKLCAEIAAMDEAGLNRVERLLAETTENLKSTETANPLVATANELTRIRSDIRKVRGDMRDLETDLTEARRRAAEASSLDSRIRLQVEKLHDLRRQRLALHAGIDGRLGIDALHRRITDIDNVSTSERIKADVEKVAMLRQLDALVAEKARLAEMYAVHIQERDQLVAERDRLNPDLARLRDLESQIQAKWKGLQQLLDEEKAARERSDHIRITASEALLGGDQVRACIAHRRSTLATAAPPAPPTSTAPPSPSTATFALGGTWTGTCAVWTIVFNGPFSIAAGAGKVTGSYSSTNTGFIANMIAGSLSGLIDSSGALTAAGAGGAANFAVQWRGSVVSSEGRWSGSGTWSGSGNGNSCQGSWQSR